MSSICARILRFCQASSGISKHLLSNSQHRVGLCGVVRKMSSSSQYQFTTLAISQPQEFVTQVELNRPEKRNAMNQVFWGEMADCFGKLATDPDCRVVVLTGAGKVFTAGLDLSGLGDILPQESDVGRKALFTRRQIKYMQNAFNALEECPKPVIAAVQGACVGGGVDMVVACDIRLASSEAWFQIKETDLGMVADLGTLQRLPKVIGNESLVRELAFTARKFDAAEAKDCGLVSRVFPTNEALLSGALEMAVLIASKSPIAVQGTKVAMLYARDNPVSNSLDQVATWTPAMLQSEDVAKAVSAQMLKEKAVFPKL